MVWNEALKISGADPDFHRRDLWNAIQQGSFPEWELGLQLFDDKFADHFDFDILDPTKIIPEEEVPVRRVGRLVLDRVVDNFFAETEQVAFCTQNIVPGIDFTNDPLLQGRNFSYLDTQLKRLGGPNFTYLPVNAPKLPDRALPAGRPHGRGQPGDPGQLRAQLLAADVGGPREDPAAGFTTYPATEAGPKRRLRPESFADHYSQARQFYTSQTKTEQRHIADAFTFELSKCDRADIRARMVAGLRNVDSDLAQQVASGLGLRQLPDQAPAARKPRTDLAESPALSIQVNGPQNFAGRKIGVLVTDGADAKLLAGLKAAAKREDVNVELVAPAVGGIEASDGNLVEADQQVDGGPSVLYDAVIVLPSSEGVSTLVEQPAGAGLRHRRLLPLQVHRLHQRRRPAIPGHRPGQAHGRRVHRDGQRHQRRRGLPLRLQGTALLGARGFLVSASRRVPQQPRRDIVHDQ